jgi:hypothetical protein
VAQIPGETFLRGGLATDGVGAVEFRTIYPGWYTGRTPHVHVKVRLGDETLTSQLYFPDAVTGVVYTMSPYDQHPGRDVPTNEADGIFAETDGRTVVGLSQEGGTFAGRLVLGIVPGANGLGQTPADIGGATGINPGGLPSGLRFPGTGDGSRSGLR